MSNPDHAHQLVEHFAAALSAGTFANGTLAQAWAQIEQRLAPDQLANATLLLFANDPGSDYLQHRLAQTLTAHLSPAELEQLIRMGQGRDTAVRSQINAAEDPLVERSGHKVVAPSGPVETRTTVGKRGQIIDSPLTIIGGPHPTTPQPPPAGRAPLPATLSADGVHFSYGHALIIGVGMYQDPSIPAVPTTTNDARALATLLRDPQRAAYPRAQVTVLLDAKATKTRILDELEALAQRLAGAPGGTALIFFAGHGEPVDNGRYALLPYDAERQRLAATALTAEQFHRAIGKVRTHAKRLVVLLNCCHAGGNEGLATNDALLTGATPPPEFYRPLAVGSGHVVISSSRPAQKSGARSRRSSLHTIFGTHLLAALTGAAPGQGPGIGVFELFTYLRASIPADARGTVYRNAPLVQEPLFYASQLDDNVAVALRPAGAPNTLGGDAALIARLVALELEQETLGTALPDAQRAERDKLLAQIEGRG